MNRTSPLPALEVCQKLTDVVLGKRIVIRSTIQSWYEIYHGLMPVEMEREQLERLLAALSLYAKHVTIADSKATETTREKATYENHHRRMGW